MSQDILRKDFHEHFNNLMARPTAGLYFQVRARDVTPRTPVGVGPRLDHVRVEQSPEWGREPSQAQVGHWRVYTNTGGIFVPA